MTLDAILAGMLGAMLLVLTGTVHRALRRWEDGMAVTKQELLDGIVSLGASIEDIRSDIANLKGQLAGGGLTADEEAEVKAALDEKVAAARALADENA